jgi:uncharacterized protein (DUF1697 family)
MRFVAFFRNLNLAQRGAPGRGEFEGAFTAAGAGNARSFQTNGTIAFDAPGRRAAQQVLRRARRALHERSGFAEPAFLRTLAALQALVASDPFSAVPGEGRCECCVTFLDGVAMPGATRPVASPRGDIRVLGYSGGDALVLADRRGNAVGNPNAYFERTLGLQATTRVWGTVCRLVAREGREQRGGA